MISEKDLKGQIYLMTCLKNGKQYIGQTKSHMWNHGKYRPFGYEGRFRGHISEAVRNVKKKQCTALNNAIRKYGAKKFEVKLIHECKPSFLNHFEKLFICEYNTIAPYGYNLNGGGGKANLTEKSRNKISESLKKYYDNEKIVKKHSMTQWKKNDNLKIKKFKKKDIRKITVTKFKYFDIYEGIKLSIKISGEKYKHTKFGGKHVSLKLAYKRAKRFIRKVIKKMDEKPDIIYKYNLKK